MDTQDTYPPVRKRKTLWAGLKEALYERFFQANGVLAVLILLGIFSLLFVEGLPALKELGLGSFFLSSNWNPTSFVKESYGLLAMLVSTLMVTAGALVIAVPVGIAAAAYIYFGAEPPSNGGIHLATSATIPGGKRRCPARI